MQSEAATVAEYLGSLPDERREALEVVRDVIVRSLPSGFSETMNWGMITYEVPLEIEPDTYNGKPLMYAGLASQKNHMAVYLSAVYSSADDAEDFKAAYRATGKKLDMGKSCVRFKRLDDLPLDLLGETIAATSVDEFVSLVDRARRK